nr:MAG TPA: hypothetical protein [Caudoviricetes sp.]
MLKLVESYICVIEITSFLGILLLQILSVV